MPIFRRIVIPEDLSSFYHCNGNQHDKELTNLSKINIFVGSNNSGKSRLLREIFSDDKISFESSQLDLKSANELLMAWQISLSETLNSIHCRYISPSDGSFIFDSKKNEYLINDEDRLAGHNFYYFVNIITQLTVFTNQNLVFYDPSRSKTTRAAGIEKAVNSKTDNTINGLRKIAEESKLDIHTVYLPTLRGLRPLSEKSDKFFDESFNGYSRRTKADYFREKTQVDQKEGKFEVFTGEKLYNEVRSHLLGDLNMRNIVQDLQEFIGNTFFEGKDFTIIPREGEKDLHIKIGEEEEFPIYNLGDGIQSIILLTFPLFINKGKHVAFFYEEPELFLHPGMQRIFLNALNMPGFETFQYFIATHSNHLLDISLDQKNVSIYKFKKELEGNKAQTNITQVFGGDVSILDELGVTNSSVFMANCSIWVEGITDRLYLKRFLELYSKQLPEFDNYNEDIHYSFIEFAGSNIEHWNFDDTQVVEKIKAQPISNRIFLIHDSDEVDGETKESKELRFKSLKEALGDNFYRLKSKEIENTISPPILEKVVKGYKGKDISLEEGLNILGTEKIEDINVYKEYYNKPIGKFIDDSFTGQVKIFESGNTLKDKKEFCEKVCAALETYEDLSDEQRDLTKKVVDFIKANNKK